MPPPTTKNKSTTSPLLSEFASYPEILITPSENLVIVGDLNPHLENPKHPSVIKVLSL